MKQVAQFARNIVHSIGLLRNEVEKGEQIITQIEAIVTTVEKTTDFHGPDLASVEKCETFRFWLHLEAAKHFRGILDEWIKDAEAERARLRFKPGAKKLFD